MKQQKADGSWDGTYGSLVTTCFSTLFLYKGRAPVLFNKLQFDGQWNNHRRDAANLTHYIERMKEQPFHWQIVNLKRPVEELHDAPILYITAETVPPLADEEKQKLRAFTDTGGTILFEASCGNPAVRAWFLKFAEEVWPEWELKPAAKDHPVFADPYEVKTPPDVLTVHDGIRDAVFYSPDDVSCAWHTQAYTGKLHLFNWGINLVKYATDDAPLRAKLAGLSKEDGDRFAGPVKAGPKTALRVARVQHEGDWGVNANYGGFGRLAALAKEKAGVALDADDRGVPPAELSGSDAAYLVGTRAFTLEPEQVEALKQYAEAGGLVWLESAGGSREFDQSVQALAEQAGWRLALLPLTHPLMTGRMDPVAGYNLTTGVLYRREMRMARLARPYAELMGFFAGDRLVGLYSPFDTMFAINPYEAYGCRGYASPDAAAVAMNVILYLTTRGQPLPGADEIGEAARTSVPKP